MRFHGWSGRCVRVLGLSSLLGAACAGQGRLAAQPAAGGGVGEAEAAIAAGQPSAGVELSALEDGTVEVRMDGELFTRVYTDGRIPYLHPVLAPGGVPMTRGFPMEPGPLDARDHPHHQSLWVAHGEVAGLDFWHDPACSIRLAGRPRIQGATLVLPLAWIGPGDQTVLREERSLSFGGSAEERWLEQTCRFLAAREGVAFGDTKEGTFAVRLRPELRVEGPHAVGSLHTSEGREGKAAWGQPASWVHCAGVVEGQHLSVALFDHPRNPRFPTRWHARTYGLVAANPFGLHHFTGSPSGQGALPVPVTEPLVFRHRLAFRAVPAASGPLTHEDLDAAAERFGARHER